jgi:hypothetical protein
MLAGWNSEPVDKVENGWAERALWRSRSKLCKLYQLVLAATADHRNANDGHCVFGAVHARVEDNMCWRSWPVNPPGPPDQM